jgi:hypothetical protein
MSAFKSDIQIIGKQNADGIVDELTVKTESGEFKVDLQKYLEQAQFSSIALKKEASSKILAGYMLAAKTPVGESRFNETARDISSGVMTNATIVWKSNESPYSERLSQAEQRNAAKNGELGGKFIDDRRGHLEPAYLTIMQQHNALHQIILEIQYPPRSIQNTMVNKILTHAEHLSNSQQAQLLNTILANNHSQQTEHVLT